MRGVHVVVVHKRALATDMHRGRSEDLDLAALLASAARVGARVVWDAWVTDSVHAAMAQDPGDYAVTLPVSAAGDVSI